MDYFLNILFVFCCVMTFTAGLSVLIWIWRSVETIERQNIANQKEAQRLDIEAKKREAECMALRENVNYLLKKL
jgi:HAMP domain-containing protein